MRRSGWSNSGTNGRGGTDVRDGPLPSDYWGDRPARRVGEKLTALDYGEPTPERGGRYPGPSPARPEPGGSAMAPMLHLPREVLRGGEAAPDQRAATG